MRHALLLSLFVLAALACPSRAEAQNCSISVTGVAFGNYSFASSSPLDSTGTVTIQCLLALNVTVTLDKGTTPTSSFTPRLMKKGADTLSYNLFRDAARGTIWGDGSMPTQAYSALLVALFPANLTIYGRITTGQNVPAGAYADTVVATIIF